jgi:hypothetical protein
VIEISRLVALRGLVRDDIGEAGHSTRSLVSDALFILATAQCGKSTTSATSLGNVVSRFHWAPPVIASPS